MSVLTLTYNGPVNIPDSVFESAHIAKGDLVDVRVEGGTIVLERQEHPPLKPVLVEGAYGWKVLRAPEGAPPMTVESVKHLLEELDSE